jgi:flagellar biosynthetic protein FliQ
VKGVVNMTIEMVTDIMREGLMVVLKTAAPPLLVSLVIGLVVSIFQTVTSIQEQTLTFVPKVVGMFVCLMLLGHWMLNNMTTYMTELWDDFSIYIR